MFPLKDTKSLPGKTIIVPILVLINIYVFYLELNAVSIEAFVRQFALVPINFSISNPLTWYPLITSQFLHGGWVHLISNVWFLMVFGPNMEKVWGKYKFLFFYLLAGVIGAILQMVFITNPTIPMLGASGAIAGILGAYFVYFPHHRINTLILLGFIPIFLAVPAGIILLYWFGLQLLGGVVSSVLVSGIAFFAHIGGFITGVLLAIGARPQKLIKKHLNFH